MSTHNASGFLCFYNEAHNLCGIATAHHVVAHADQWLQPIRISHYTTNTNAFLRDSDRVIWVDENKDSAVILFNVGDLQLPEQPVQLLPTDNRLPIGVEVGWLGYPGLAAYTLCFFSGNVSAWQDFRNAYLIDGVAINGVSGGPVIYSTDGTAANVSIVGTISAYRANRATGETLPGLSIAQDVTHFQAMVAHVRTIDEANRQRAEAEAAAQAQAQNQAQQEPPREGAAAAAEPPPE